MLYFLYQTTANAQWFHSVVQKFILLIEIPLLTLFLKLAGASKVISRNSIHDKAIFNVFMSDLDFSIVATDESFTRIYKVSILLKKIFVNMGELELYTLSEWTELEELQHSSYWSFWTRVYLVRKLSWQLEKQKKAHSRYEKVKQERALKITFSRLGMMNNSLQGSKIFYDLPIDNTLQIHPPFESKFLEFPIGLMSDLEQGVGFETLSEARSFYAILPDCQISPSSVELKQIKQLLIKREALLNANKIKLKRIQGLDTSVDQIWAKDLSDRLK